MKIKALLLAAAALVPAAASAQYYEIANQLPQMISPVLSGSFNYKGFIEGGYSQGFGNCKANFAEISTSQGFQYANWFYMGVGLGVDVLFSDVDDGWNSGQWGNPSDFDYNHSSRTTAVMIPLFTDFRFTIGGNPYTGKPMTRPAFFIDLKVGCSFLCSDDYIRIHNGYLTSQQYFYLKPSIGVRIPVNGSSKQAVDIGVSYKLLTSNYWSSWSRNVTLNSVGVNIAYEW